MEIDQSLELKHDWLFDKIILYAATGLFTLTIILTATQVLVRVFEIPMLGSLNWTQPAARFILIVATYLGAAVALRNNEHIAIQFLLERLTNRNKTIGNLILILGKLIVVGFLAVALVGLARTTIVDWTTSIGGIGFVTAGHLYLGIGIGFLLMLIYAVIDVGSLLRGVLSNE